MKGPQADVGAGWWGKLYEENGRGILWDKSGEKHVKVDDWNDLRIDAQGSRVRTWINGQLCVDLDDAKMSRRGIFALQIHCGRADGSALQGTQTGGATRLTGTEKEPGLTTRRERSVLAPNEKGPFCVRRDKRQVGERRGVSPPVCRRYRRCVAFTGGLTPRRSSPHCWPWSCR